MAFQSFSHRTVPAHTWVLHCEMNFVCARALSALAREKSNGKTATRMRSNHERIFQTEHRLLVQLLHQRASAYFIYRDLMEILRLAN